MSVHGSYKELLQIIVDKHLPNESLVFEIDGDDIVKDALESNKRTSQSNSGPRLGGGDTLAVIGVLNVIAVAAGGMKTFLEIFKLYKEQSNKAPPDMSGFTSEFEARLRDSGIDSEKAAEIVKDFRNEAVNLLTK